MLSYGLDLTLGPGLILLSHNPICSLGIVIHSVGLDLGVGLSLRTGVLVEERKGRKIRVM